MPAGMPAGVAAGVSPGGATGPGREFFDRPADQVAPGLLGWVLEHETADGLVAVELTEVEAYLGAIDPASHSYRGRTARNGVMFGPPGYAYVYFTYGMHFCVNVTCQPPGTATAVLLRAGRIVAGEQLARRRRAARRPPPVPAPDPALSQGSVLAGNVLAGDAAKLPSGQVSDLPSRDVPRIPTNPLDGLPSGNSSRASAGGPSHFPADRPPDAAADQASDQAAAAAALAFRDLARGPARLCVALAIDRTQDGLDLFDPASPLRLRPPVAAHPGAAVNPGTTPHPGTAAHPGTTAVPGTAAPEISTGPRVGITLAAEVPWRFWLAGDPTVSPYRPGKRRSR
jgi:DNA-3-methyladenine glycosylase